MVLTPQFRIALSIQSRMNAVLKSWLYLLMIGENDYDNTRFVHMGITFDKTGELGVFTKTEDGWKLVAETYIRIAIDLDTRRM